MAITTAATTTISTHKLPTGYTAPVVAALTDPNVEPFETSIDRTAFENASAATGFTALLADVKTWIDATFVATLGLDALETITGRIVVTKLEHSFSGIDIDDDTVITKTATAQVKVTGVFQWAVSV